MSSTTPETKLLRLEALAYTGSGLTTYAELMVPNTLALRDAFLAMQAMAGGLSLCGNIYADAHHIGGINTFGDVWCTRTGQLLAQAGAVEAAEFKMSAYPRSDKHYQSSTTL